MNFPRNVRLANIYIDRLGKSATLREYTDSGNVDSQGDTKWNESDSTVTVIRGFGTNTRVPERLYTEAGDSRPMDFEFIIKESDAPSTSSVEPTGKNPILILDGVQYRIVEMEDMRIGFKRLICESRRV